MTGIESIGEQNGSDRICRKRQLEKTNRKIRDRGGTFQYLEE